MTLSNGSGANITISSATIGADFIISSTACGAVLNAGQSCNYQVTFKPLSTGVKNEVLRVFDSANLSPQKAQMQGTGQ